VYLIYQFNSVTLVQTQQGTYNKYLWLWGPYNDIRQTICYYVHCSNVYCCIH